MADSTIVKVHKKIAELIAADYSGGHSEVSLVGKVVRGSVIEPPFTPYASVHFQDAIEEFGDTLGRYKTDSVFEVYCFAAGGNLMERNDASLNLVSDCIKALTANRSLGLNGLIDDVKCSYLALDGDRYGIDGVGIGYIRVEVKFQTDTGA